MEGMKSPLEIRMKGSKVIVRHVRVYGTKVYRIFGSLVVTNAFQLQVIEMA